MSLLRKRPDWSRPLPRPLTIPGIVTLVTLGDVRALIEKHLPAHCRDKATWRHVSQKLAEAAHGGDAADVATSLVMVLALESVPCRPAREGN
jgi:hypothetical protein